MATQTIHEEKNLKSAVLMQARIHQKILKYIFRLHID